MRSFIKCNCDTSTCTLTCCVLLCHIDRRKAQKGTLSYLVFTVPIGGGSRLKEANHNTINFK